MKHEYATPVAEAVGTTDSGQPRALIAIRNLRKSFGQFTAVEDFCLEVREGEIVSLLGPSGCGKTTTLRCLAGLETPTSGEIEVQGRLVYSSEKRINVPPEQRNLSMVFQQYALWPHMTVYENAAFGLRVRREPQDVVDQKVKSVLERVRLWEKRQQRISQLSGGQQQRVALARALSIDPEIILFDEPLSNLDAKLREELRLEILQLQRELRFSAIFVTHDQDEAISLSSRIVIMNQGRCEQIGSPEDIWYNPDTSFVARFTGSSNSFAGKVIELNDGEGLMRVRTSAGLDLTLPLREGFSPGDNVELFARMNEVRLGVPGADPSPNSWTGSVELVSFQGDSSLVEVRIGEERLFVRESSSPFPREGDTVQVTIPGSIVRMYKGSSTAPA